MEDEGNGLVADEDRDDALVRALTAFRWHPDPVPAAVVTAAKQAFAQRRAASGVEVADGERGQPRANREG
jgi:hypothetical protein